MEVFMDLIIPILLTTVSYFFLAYFIYIISGRKKGLTQGILYFLAIISFYQTVIKQWHILSTPTLIYGAIASIIPPLLALLLLRYLMGDFHKGNIKFRRSKLKGIKEVKDTIYYQVKFVYLALSIPLILGVLAFLTLESFLLYSTLLLSIAVFVYGLISYVKLQHIKSEKLILLIGKDKENIYTQEVLPKTNHIDIKTYFQNDNYLIDHLGILDLVSNKEVIRHHLYWIGTSDKVVVDDHAWEKVKELPYQDDVSSFEKYHYIQATYHINKDEIKRIKFKRLK